MNKTIVVFVLAIGLMASTASADLVSAVVSAPVDYPASPDEYVTISLTLTGSGTMEGFGVQINYDPTVLVLPNVSGTSTSDITPGSSISNWYLGTYLSSGQGSVNVSCYDTSGENAVDNPSDLVILDIDFHVLPSAEVGSTTISLVDYEDYEWTFQNGSINVVPEPSSLVMMAGLLAGAAFVAIRRKRKLS